MRQLRRSIWIDYHRMRCKVDGKTSPVCVSMRKFQHMRTFLTQKQTGCSNLISFFTVRVCLTCISPYNGPLVGELIFESVVQGLLTERLKMITLNKRQSILHFTLLLSFNKAEKIELIKWKRELLPSNPTEYEGSTYLYETLDSCS